MSYMIFVAGASAPQKEHATEAEARAEAERLSAKNPDRYVYLLELVDVLEPVKHHRWRRKPTTANPPQPEPVVIPPMAPYAPSPVPVVPQRMPDVVYYGCQVVGPPDVALPTTTITWYAEEADNDD